MIRNVSRSATYLSTIVEEIESVGCIRIIKDRYPKTVSKAVP
jgi:hypothetical protein